MSASMTPTLYQRLGGAERIAAIVETAVELHAVNPVLAPRLGAADLRRIKHLGAHFVCAGLGGPPTYEGVDLRGLRAVAGAREFDALVADVVAALNAHGIAPADVDEAVDFLLSLRQEGSREHASRPQ
jgi:hemoglobin